MRTETRRPPRPLALACATLAVALSGAACAPRSFLMDAGEYGVYRQARAARSLEERLTASHEYLARYPDGVYAADVRAYFDRVEPKYFARARGSLVSLEAYLKALPKGPHAAEATLRLRDLRALDKAERTDLAGTATAVMASVARETERRQAVRARLQQWIGVFLDAGVFRTTMAEAKADLIVPWSLGLPWPFCERTDSGPEAPTGGPSGAARRCTKLLQLDYRAMENGEPQERQALVEIAVWQDEDGRPLEVTLGGPELFLRLEETVTARGAAANDPEARLRGAERAVEIGQAIFTEKVTAPSSPRLSLADCKKTADTDVARFACRGLELRIIASALDGEDDRFVVRPSP